MSTSTANTIPDDDKDAQVDLLIRRNATFKVSFALTREDDDGNQEPWDITGYEIHAAIKKTYKDAEYLARFSIEGRDDENGAFTLVLPYESAKLIGDKIGTAYWDCVITDADDVRTVVAWGSVSFPGVVT